MLNIFYPPTCGICNKLCKEYICDECYQKLEQYKINKFYIKDNIEFFNIYKYEGTIRKKLLEYKFYDKSYLYNTFSKIILKNEKVCGFLKKYDIIISVPVDKKRKTKRGYNQVELIARKLGITYESKTLIKQKNIVSQSELNRIQRKQNIKGAFKLVNEEKIKNKKILLLDDIYTTGSTVKECCKTLKNARTK